MAKRTQPAHRRFRKWRGDRSQSVIGELLGVSQSTIARIESGEVTPSLRFAQAIAHHSGIPAEAWPCAR